MNEIIAVVFGIAVTPWKLIGYLGVLLFAGRWVVQVIATRANGRPVIPRAFWLMSVSGSAMLLAYFIWGKNDSVGVLSNLFPAAVAVYNLFMDLNASREDARPTSVDDPMDGHLSSR
jgi:lipid-A-disaccharide synthase-like uncharacterized protein